MELFLKKVNLFNNSRFSILGFPCAFNERRLFFEGVGAGFVEISPRNVGALRSNNNFPMSLALRLVSIASINLLFLFSEF